MRYVSLFSGIEAASVAWTHMGWEPLAFAEVDPFACAVLAHRFPHVPNLGDVCGIDWKGFHEEYGIVDVLIGGSPCQSFSVAGNREGLKGESRLMYEYIRAIRELVEYSDGAGPRYVLFENVPGVLSSGPKGQKGSDFQCLLRELDGIGFGVSWRILDSQYARVPDGQANGFRGPVAQRRRRVFLVGVLGSDGSGEILFERTCLRGDHPKGQEARKALAEGPAGRAGMCGGAGFKYRQGSGAGNIGYEQGQSPTVTADSVCIQGNVIGRTDGNGPQGKGTDMELSFTLNTTDRHAVAFAQNTRDEVRLIGGDGSHVGAISAQPGMKQQAYVMQDASSEQPIVIDRAAFNQGEKASYPPPHIERSETMDTIVARGPHAVCCRTEGR